MFDFRKHIVASTLISILFNMRHIIRSFINFSTLYIK